MPKDYLIVGLAGVAAFVFSSVYYSPLVIGNVWRAVDPVAVTLKPTPLVAVIEFVRTLIIAFVLAHLLALLGNPDWKSGMKLAFWLWFGFSAMMWVGAIMWEKTPWQVALIHSGDWLVKTQLVAVILGAWRG